MSHKFSSIPSFAKYQPFTQTTTREIFNASHEIVSAGRQSKFQRWIFGMIIGSAPFLIILMCWMFVSVCINNLVRFYQHKKKGYRRGTETNGIGNISPKMNV
jgi:hypothetical protein